MEFQDPDIDLSEKVAFIEKDHTAVQDVITEFEMFGSSVLEDLLREIAISPNFTADEKLPVLDALFTCSINRDGLEDLIAAYVPSSAVFEIKTIKWLLTFDPEKYINRLYKYLANAGLQDSVRYSQITELKQDYPSVAVKASYYMHTLPSVSERVKILAGQFYLQYGEHTNQYTTVLKNILSIAEDEKVEYNTRADAADTVHHYGDGDIQRTAFALLKMLGGNARSIYENKQNIHSVDISESLAFIEKQVVSVSYDKIAEELKGLCEKAQRDSVKVSAALGRILLDVARYGRTRSFPGWNAIEITERIWAYILSRESPLKEQLKHRILEELEEMADTCSSGHSIRILNAISGYGADVKITFQDQIVGNFNGRMTYRLTHIENKDDQEAVLVDMVDKGPNYIKFYIKFMPLVMAEMRKEFVPEFITDDQFDDYIREAIARFESGK
jgi:hypothetical protein